MTRTIQHICKYETNDSKNHYYYHIVIYIITITFCCYIIIETLLKYSQISTARYIPRTANSKKIPPPCYVQKTDVTYQSN